MWQVVAGPRTCSEAVLKGVVRPRAVVGNWARPNQSRSWVNVSGCRAYRRVPGRLRRLIGGRGFSAALRKGCARPPVARQTARSTPAPQVPFWGSARRRSASRCVPHAVDLVVQLGFDLVSENNTAAQSAAGQMRAWRLKGVVHRGSRLWTHPDLTLAHR